MDGNPTEPAGPDGAASRRDDVSPWPRTGEFALSYQPPPTDFGGGFIPSETSAIPLGPLYLQTPYRDPADYVAPAPPPGYPGQTQGQGGYPPPYPDPAAPAGDATYYEQASYHEQAPPSPWQEQSVPWPAAPPEQQPGWSAGQPGPAEQSGWPVTPPAEQSSWPAASPAPEPPGWPAYGESGTHLAPGQASVPIDASADYGIPPPAPYGQWVYGQPDQGSPPDPGDWFTPADTGAIPIGPRHESPPVPQQYPAAPFAGPPTQLPGPPYEGQFTPDAYGGGYGAYGAYGQSPSYGDQPDPEQSRQVTGYQVEFYAYQRTIYQQPPGAPGSTPFPPAEDPAAQTGAFPLYYPPPPADLGGSGFAATDTSAIPIMPVAPAWSDDLTQQATAAPDLAPADTAWPYSTWPADAGDAWPPMTFAAPDATAVLPAGAWADGSTAEGSTDDSTAGATSADEPAASSDEPAATGAVVAPTGTRGLRARRRRRRRVALLAVCCLLVAAVAGTLALRLVGAGDDQGGRDALTAGTLAPGGEQPRVTRTYPFPVIALTQRGAAGAPAAPATSAAGTMPPGGAFGQAVGAPVHPSQAGATPSVGKPRAPAPAPTTTVTPAVRGNFPPAPPAPFPVPGE